jgi:hypothetical protein
LPFFNVVGVLLGFGGLPVIPNELPRLFDATLSAFGVHRIFAAAMECGSRSLTEKSGGVLHFFYRLKFYPFLKRELRVSSRG